MGAPGTGTLPNASQAPDLKSATIVTTVQPSDPGGPVVRFCFDRPLTAVNPALFFTNDYDSARGNRGVGTAQPDAADTTCTNVTFANGADIEQGTTGVAEGGAVTQAGGLVNPVASVPLSGSKLAKVAGATAAPDLASAQIINNTSVIYTFDENLRPNPGTYAPANFGFYITQSKGQELAGTGGTNATGGTITSVSGKTVTVAFPASVTNLSSAKQFYVKQGAVQDQVENFGPAAGTPSTIGITGAAIPGAPELDGATKGTNGQDVTLHFTQAVNPVPGGVNQFFAYREDGETSGILPGDSVSLGNDTGNQTLIVTFPADAQKDNPSLVRVGMNPGAATARNDPTTNATFGQAAIDTANFTPGYSDGPDLLSTKIDDATNRATFNYDEAIGTTPAPVAPSFQLVRDDGTTTPGLDGVVVSSDKKSVTVHFGSSVSSSVGVANAFNAIGDETQQANAAQEASVGLDLIPGGCQTGSCTTVTPTATATAPGVTPTATVPVTTPTPTPTTTPGSRKVSSTVASLKKKGKKITGKVSAKAPCKSGRSVVAKKGSKTLASAKSKGSGKFTLSSKKIKKAKGKVTVTIKKRTLTSGGVKVTCSAKSKKV